MKTLVVVCNVVFFAFTCVVLATDGLPKEVPYILLTLAVLLVPVLTVVALLRARLMVAAAIANLVVLGLMVWSFVAQYPHPQEEGFVEYVVLAALTPILSAIVLFVRARGKGRRDLRLGDEVLQG